MQYEQTAAHMEDSSNHSSICYKCHPEHTSFGMGLPSDSKVGSHPYIPMGNHPYISMGNNDYLSIEVLMRHAIGANHCTHVK